MISYQDAIETMLSHIRVMDRQEVSMTDSVGRTLADSIRAKFALPAFRNSSMDGYAFRACDVSGAAKNTPVTLRLVGESKAGTTTIVETLPAKSAISIMTGGRLPDNADTILPMEDSHVVDNNLLITNPVTKGMFVRAIGTDWLRDESLMPEGALLRPEHLPALCAQGVTSLMVYRRPKVVWLSTGPELVDDPNEPLGPSQIYNATGFFGNAVLTATGADLVDRYTLGDDNIAFTRSVTQALNLDADMIISTGAVSVGTSDFIRSAAEDMGATVHVHRVRVRPGKPVLFATFPNNTIFIGLPGNPVSTAASFRMFVTPVLRAMLGQAIEVPFQACLTEDCVVPSNLTVFLRAQAVITAAHVRIQAAPHQESFKTRSLFGANAWIIHPEGTAMLKSGSLVSALPLWPDSLRINSATK